VNISGKTIMVIGGAGLVGSHTIDALRETDVSKIIVYDNFKRGKLSNISHSLADKRVRVVDVPADVLRQDTLASELNGVHGVIHLASLWLTYSQQFPRSAVEENVLGAFNVFEACLKAEVEKVVFASSASVYGDAVIKPMTECHPLNNLNIYGATKICMEALATAFHSSYKLPLLGLRYFNIYGPRQDSRGAYNSVVVKLLDSAEQNAPLIIFGDGEQSYDFVSVSDIARANVCGLSSDADFGLFNICTGRATSINELASIIKAATRSRSLVEYRPGTVSLVRDRVGCPIKAKNDIGFEARVSLEEGVTNFASWRRSLGSGAA
jgi:UDP-glucose 4-epimerase